MKTVGIVGGIGPESTIEYYRFIIEGYRERTTDGSYPSIIINSVDLNRLIGWINAGELEPFTDYLAAAVEQLARAGADFAVLAANTAHIVFDQIRESTAKNRPQYYQDFPLAFYGYNRPGAEIKQGVRDNWWRQAMMGGIKAQYDCIKAFSETDFTEDLKQIDVPTLVMHGEDDQIVPFADSGPLSAKLLMNATTKFYLGFPHGMPTTHADQINADLLTFIAGQKSAAA
jgi:pimeloyl-ACP methyl ester carboxylesterase